MTLPDLSLLLIMVLFWATYAVLRAWVFKPLGGILEEREKKTATATDALAKALENGHRPSPATGAASGSCSS